MDGYQREQQSPFQNNDGPYVYDPPRNYSNQTPGIQNGGMIYQQPMVIAP